VYEFLIYVMRATCLAHLVHPNLTVIILGEEYKLGSSTLRSFLQTPVISSLLGPKFSSAHCSYTPSIYVPLMWETKFHTHTKQRVILNLFSYLLFIDAVSCSDYTASNYTTVNE
jgi:hypothetical protein